MLTLRMFSKAEGEKAVKREYDRLASDYETRWAFYINRSVQERLNGSSSTPATKFWTSDAEPGHCYNTSPQPFQLST